MGDDALDLVLAKSSPLRDRSNEALTVDVYKTPKKRRSLGGEDVGRRRRPSAGSPQEDPRPVAEAEMMSFDEMRKQLSLWQSHLRELTAEHREAEKLRQDTSCLRSKLVNSEAEASERARRLVETRVEVQQKSQELATTQEELNKKFIELAQEKEASQQLREQICQLRDESEEQLQLKCQELLEEKDVSGKLKEELQALNDSGSNAERLRAALEAELAETRTKLQENEVQSSRLQAEKLELTEVVRRLENQLQEQQADAKRTSSEAIASQQNLKSELTTVRGALEAERKLSALQQEKLLNLTEQASVDHLQLQDMELELAQAKNAYATFETQHHLEVQLLNSEVQEVTGRAELAETQRKAAVQEVETQRQEVQRLTAAEATLKAALDGHSQQLAVSLQEHQQVQRQLQALQKVHADSLEGQRDREAWKNQAETEEAHAAALKLEVEEATEALEAAQQEATLWKQRAEVMLGRRKAIMQVAARWQGSDAAWEWMMEQGQGPELQDLPEGSELRLQNRELCLSLRQFKQDCELLESENLSLKEALTCMEEDLHRVSDQHAQLVGHVNHRQKIRYTMKLKEEINRLCSELKKARQRIVQLEVSKESESLFEALASVVGTPVATRKRPSNQKKVAEPNPNRRVGGAKVKAGNKGPGDDAEIRLAEAEQLCMLQQSALDRISMDFQHLKALIERAVMLADTERRNGADGGNFAALLHRLREIIAANHRTPSCAARELGPLPVAATSIADDDDMELAEGDVICYGQQQVPELD